MKRFVSKKKLTTMGALFFHHSFLQLLRRRHCFHDSNDDFSRTRDFSWYEQGFCQPEFKGRTTFPLQNAGGSFSLGRTTESPD